MDSIKKPQNMKPKVLERMTEYIMPYQDNGIGNKINLKMVSLLWLIILLWKIICKDYEWGFFIMLLLFILPFFITKEMEVNMEETDDISTIEDSSSTSSSSSEITNFQKAKPNQKMAEVSSTSASSSFDEPKTMSSEEEEEASFKIKAVEKNTSKEAMKEKKSCSQGKG